MRLARLLLCCLLFKVARHALAAANVILRGMRGGKGGARDREPLQPLRPAGFLFRWRNDSHSFP
jgi:hypothetical protein